MTEQPIEAGTGATPQIEPAAVAEAFRVLAAALVGTGWLTIDSTLLNWLITVFGLLISLALTGWTRSHVTPLVAPRDADLHPLVRVTPPQGGAPSAL